MRPIRDCLQRFCRDTSGATALEYGLLMALIFIAIIGAVTAMADANSRVYQKVEDAIVVSE